MFHIWLHSNIWSYYFLEFSAIHFILQYLLSLVLLFVIGTWWVWNRDRRIAVTSVPFRNLRVMLISFLPLPWKMWFICSSSKVYRWYSFRDILLAFIALTLQAKDPLYGLVKVKVLVTVNITIIHLGTLGITPGWVYKIQSAHCELWLG